MRRRPASGRRRTSLDRERHGGRFHSSPRRPDWSCPRTSCTRTKGYSTGPTATSASTTDAGTTHERVAESNATARFRAPTAVPADPRARSSPHAATGEHRTATADITIAQCPAYGLVRATTSLGPQSGQVPLCILRFAQPSVQRAPLRPSGRACPYCRSRESPRDYRVRHRGVDSTARSDPPGVSHQSVYNSRSKRRVGAVASAVPGEQSPRVDYQTGISLAWPPPVHSRALPASPTPAGQAGARTARAAPDRLRHGRRTEWRCQSRLNERWSIGYHRSS